MMIPVTIFLFILLHTIHSYPDGAPSCVSKPAHGSSKQAVSLQVVKIAQRKWKVVRSDVKLRGV